MRIRTEQDAWGFLAGCLQDPSHGGDRPLAYENCCLQIRLDPGDGQADRKTARAVNLLQRHLELIYLLATRGTRVGRLSSFEKDLLGVRFRVEAGSTNIIVDISNAIQTIQRILPAHISTRTRNIIAVGALLGTVAYPCGQEYAAYRAKVDQADIAAAATIEVAERTNRTNLEIARVQADAQITVAKITAAPNLLEAASATTLRIDGSLILASLSHDDTTGIVSFAVSDYVPWRPAFLSLAPFGGTIEWNDSKPIPARAAKAIAEKTRGEATKQRRVAKLNGKTPLIETPWVTEVLRTHYAPGAMRLGLSNA